jgi:hypothetical protein
MHYYCHRVTTQLQLVIIVLGIIIIIIIIINVDGNKPFTFLDYRL